MAVEGLGKRDVGTGIEVIRQLRALVIQVGIHSEALVVAAVGPQRLFAGLGLNTKALIDFMLAAIRQVRDAPRCRQALARALGGGIIVAAVPEGIAFNRGNLRRLDTNLPRGGARRDGDNARGINSLGIHQRPFQGARAAHGTADDRMHARYSELFQRLLLRGHQIANG